MLFRIVSLIIAIIIHEVAHGYVAYRLGDNTAKYQGRLSLNPLRHVDPVGSLLIPMMLILSGSSFVFGWAKPVPINQHNFYDPKKGMMLTALAGPLANFSLAYLCSLFLRFVFTGQSLAAAFLINLIIINLVLGLFNLIPIPPLDGSKVLAYFLKGQWSYRYLQLEPYGTAIVFVLVYLGFFRYFFSWFAPLFRLFL